MFGKLQFHLQHEVPQWLAPSCTPIYFQTKRCFSTSTAAEVMRAASCRRWHTSAVCVAPQKQAGGMHSAELRRRSTEGIDLVSVWTHGVLNGHPHKWLCLRVKSLLASSERATRCSMDVHRPNLKVQIDGRDGFFSALLQESTAAWYP